MFKKSKMSKRVSFFLILCLLIPFFTFIQPLVVLADGDDYDYDGDQLEADAWSMSFPNTDPWQILASGDEVVYLGGERLSGSLFTILKQTVILFCIIGAFGCVIAIPWVNSRDGIKANKGKLTHKLLVMAGVFAVIPGFNIVKYLLDSMFGW